MVQDHPVEGGHAGNGLCTMPLDGVQQTIKVHTGQQAKGISANEEWAYSKNVSNNMEKGRPLNNDILSPWYEAFTEFEMLP
jgi:hypothetical protein